ncbi:MULTISPECIES: LCP family protein [Gordonibacter]|uniref:LCP family protein n=1 Tax=Gordonibacter faecis TaxID=3047475 RepID=A0ABT7DPG1_9ACTN|nr:MULTISPECIES: LCP family protein [unclassified Gordonibacter]MDJ1651418.1 LCP family protein [Gordonibacter sp. KGMB12511]HIW76010.1 LCP family protein [Candidatus Gordonibacter avicola]
MSRKSSQRRSTRRPSDSAGIDARSGGSSRDAAERRGASSPAHGRASTRTRGGDQARPAPADRLEREPRDPRALRDARPERDSRDAPYNRRISQAEYAQRRKRAKRKKTALIVLAVALVVCLVGAGAAFAYYQTLSSNLHDGIDDDLRRALDIADNGQPYEGGPFYMLLMGTDGSSDREASAEYAGDQFRSDSMMLARIDPQGKKVTLVSLHRDTLVDMGENGQQKLNAAHSIGGAAYTVETVSKLAGVPITHYAEINFDGFKDIVDALGGVEVDVPMTIDDEDAGGHLDAGLQTLSGDQALILCRARHAYDEFGDGDRYRAANQRLVLSAIAKKILSADPATMVSSVQALSRYVTTDFEISDILSIALSLRGLDPAKDFYTAMEPTTSAYINGGWYEYLDAKAWKTMMSRVDQGLSPTEEDEIDATSGTVLATTGSGEANSDTSGSSGKKPGSAGQSNKRSGTVLVRNGNGLTGAGAEAASKLEERGYTVETGNAESFDYSQTIVVYERDDQATEAKEIANAIGVGKAQLNNGDYAFEGDFLVVLGADWQG